MRIFSSTPAAQAPPPAAKEREHGGWDLPPHVIQLMSIPISTAVQQLVGPPPPPPGSNGFLNAIRLNISSPFVRTENGALAHGSTGSSLTDLFFDLAPQVAPDHLHELLEKAWAEDSIATLKIIFHARSIHEGKGFEEGFFRAMAWVYEKHPKTFLENLAYIVEPTCERQRDKERDAKLAKNKMEQKGKDDMGVVEMDDEDEEDPKEYPKRPHGCFDDLNDMLVLYINGQFKTSYTGKLDSINEALAPAGQRYTMKTVRERDAAKNGKGSAPAQTRPGRRRIKAPRTKTPGCTLHDEKTKIGKQIICRERFERVIASDKKFQALYLVVVDIFVKQLRADLKLYNEDRESRSTNKSAAHDDSIFGLSFAAKWAVTPGKGTDKQLMIASAIALGLFPGDGIKSARRRFQAEILSPLRAALSVVEVKMSANKWDQVEYNKVPSRSMERNTRHFASHDSARFDKYLYKVAEGQTTISGASMFPHQLLMQCIGNDIIKGKVADLQWRTLVQSIRNSTQSSLKNCLAVADVSGSMGSFSYGSQDVNASPQPIYPCIALTLLLSELAVEPWHGSYFTFSSQPSLEYISPALSLSDRARKLSRAHWEMNTNFHKVFQLILAKAQLSKLAPEDMVKTLFVFSDMQFDQAGGCNFGETQYTTIKREFDAAGYQIPEIIFWNLASRARGTPKPVKADQPGVSLLSGYSGSMMKYFLGREEDEDIVEVEVEVKDEAGDIVVKKVKTKTTKEYNPYETMVAVISKPPFSGVVVVD